MDAIPGLDRRQIKSGKKTVDRSWNTFTNPVSRPPGSEDSYLAPGTGKFDCRDQSGGTGTGDKNVFQWIYFDFLRARKF